MEKWPYKRGGLSWGRQFSCTLQGRIQDFKLGGVHLKKSRRAEGGVNIFGVFRVKNHDFMQKNHIFPILGGRAPDAPPPGSAPALYFTISVPLKSGLIRGWTLMRVAL